MSAKPVRPGPVGTVHRPIAQIGQRPHRTHVFARDVVRRDEKGRPRSLTIFVVEWRAMVGGERVRRRRNFADANISVQLRRTKAVAFAESINAQLVRQGELEAGLASVDLSDVTLEELHRRYLQREAVGWAPATRRNHQHRWGKFTPAFKALTTLAKTVTPEHLDAFVEALEQADHVASERARIVTTVKSVFRFGAQRKLCGWEVPAYQIKRLPGDKAKRIGEFTPAETFGILAELKPRPEARRNAPQRPWRAWAASLLAACTAKRTRSQVLALQWPDIRWVRGGAVVRWPAERDKLRREHDQPMTRRGAALLRLIRWMHRRDGIDSRWVFPAVRTPRLRKADQPYSYSALYGHVVKACARAGVEREVGQALHAFRRFGVNEVLEATNGNVKLAALWANDTDLKTLQASYIRERGQDQQRVAATLPAPDKVRKEKKKTAGGEGRRAVQEQDTTTTGEAP